MTAPTTIPTTTIARRPVNIRSVALGLFGVVFICGLTPFNDYVAVNTNLIGSHLPIGLLVFFFIFVTLINAPLWRWAPRKAFHANELAVALGMMLVSCALPSAGLMRYLPGHLTSFFENSANESRFADLMRELDPPDWMFPAMKSHDPAARGNDPVVRDFVGRKPVAHDTFGEHFRAVPWSAWRTPALTWGILLVFLFGAVICMAVIFRHQWADNERLPFPLATIQLALIETPAPGFSFNTLLRSRAFWISLTVVFVARGINALHIYKPALVPELPLAFDLRLLLRNPPFSYTDPDFHYSSIYFAIVGISFFLQTKVSFSIWFFYVAVQVFQMFAGGFGTGVNGGMRDDQMFGAVIPFGLAAIWIGRRHLAVVFKQMFRAPADNEVRGRYLPYGFAGWGFLICFAGFNAWLIAAGASLAGALVITLMIMLVFLCVMRIVAATGMLYVLLPVMPIQPWVMALQYFGTRTTLRSFFYSNWFFGMFLHDTREALPGFAMNAMRIADEAAYPNERNWRRAVPFTLSLVLALAVGYVVAGASMLYCEYSYSSSLSHPVLSPINAWGAHLMPQRLTLNYTRAYIPSNVFRQPYSRVGHFMFGAGLTTALSVLRLRYEAWPFHPVGYLLAYCWGIGQIWFSVLLGWLAKLVIVRFGGSRAMLSLKPIMMGLILGEASASAFWLVVGLIRLWMGLSYQSIQFMPI